MTKLLNNLDLLEKFVTYFKQEACKIISIANEERIILPFLKPSFIRSFDIDTNTKKNFLQLIDPQPLAKQLTLRELECLNYLFTGLTAKEIAQLLLISPKTVIKHIENIRTKLHCKKTTQVIKKSIELGILNAHQEIF